MSRCAAALAILLLAAVVPVGAAPAAGTTAASEAPDSLYQFAAKLTDQSGRAISFDVHRGHPVIVTMFYASCPAACPLLIDTMRAIERALDAESRAELRVLMITVDPEHDTPEALAQLAKSRRLDLARWTLATSDEATIRRIAALLSIQYRELPDGNFNHSSVITVLSPEGRILRQSSMLGRVDPDIVGVIDRR